MFCPTFSYNLRPRTKMEKGYSPNSPHTDTDTTDNNISTATLKVEELECGVSVEGACSAERQEWAFTLYDFDGRGRVTKEDLAQLLKSLYDAVGSSISLPQAGAKSLKLRLSVTPDQSKLPSCEGPATAAPSTPHPRHRDLNRKECNIDKEKRHAPKKDVNSKLNNDPSTSPSRSWDSGKKVRNINGFVNLPPVEMRNNLSKSMREEEGQGGVQPGDPGHTPASKRLSATEQQQLAELVQINMTWNQQKGRKLSRSQRRERESSKQLSRRSVDVSRRSVDGSRVLENADRRHYYMDLAGIDSSTSPPQMTPPVVSADVLLSMSAPAAVLDCTTVLSPTKCSADPAGQASAATVSSPPAHQVKKATKTVRVRTPRRSKQEKTDPTSKNSTQSPSKQLLSPRESSTPTHSPQHHNLSKPHHHLSPSRRTSSPKKSLRSSQPTETSHPPKAAPTAEEESVGTTRAVHGSTSSPVHHHRRKFREKNHIRAMKQVSEWIEKEQIDQLPEEEVQKSDLEDVIVQKHEHHHIHEHHHHHHYHHYHET